jgi:large subunit ribosomal protein L10
MVSIMGARKHTRTLTWKKQELEQIKELAKKYKVVGIADIRGFQSPSFQELRKKLGGKAVIRVTRSRVAKRGLAAADMPEQFVNYCNGSIALIFTNENPFELFKLIKESATKIPARQGMVAPDDIVVKAGNTGLPPGPDLADLKAAGINAQMKGASIVIPEDVVLVKKGERISLNAAKALAKLGIKPIESRLNVLAMTEQGKVFDAELLDIDYDAFRGQLIEAHTRATNVALGLCMPTRFTVEALLIHAHRRAFLLGVECSLVNEATLPAIVSKAVAYANALKGLVKDAASKPQAKAEQSQEQAARQTSEQATPQEQKEQGSEVQDEVSEQHNEPGKDASEEQVKKEEK